jgi:pseudouridine kinase
LVPTRQRRKRGYVVAIGGANIDIICRIAGRVATATSNPGAVSDHPGGVARNIAHNLAQLGVAARLISAVGRDAPGRRLLAATAAAGVDIRGVMRAAGATGSYTAVLNAGGQLLVGVAAMEILERLTPRRLARHGDMLGAADLAIADGNLPTATLAWLIDVAAERRLRLAIETVSVPKARRLAPLLSARRPLFALFCNGAEAAALTGRRGMTAAVRALHGRGVRHVCIGLGRRGMLVSTGKAPRLVAALPGPIVDVTGAGDAAVAATLYGLLRGEPLATAARHGQAAAALTLACRGPVNPRLSVRAISRCIRSNRPSP